MSYDNLWNGEKYLKACTRMQAELKLIVESFFGEDDGDDSSLELLPVAIEIPR